MEGVVDEGLALGAGVIVLDHSAQRLAAQRHGKRDHRGGAAAGGRAGAGAEIVAGLLPFPGLLVHMTVAVDTARGDEQACGIDHLFCPAEVVAQGGDAALADSDVGAEEIAPRRDLGIADEEIEFRSHQALNDRRTSALPDAAPRRPGGLRQWRAPAAAARRLRARPAKSWLPAGQLPVLVILPV